MLGSGLFVGVVAASAVVATAATARADTPPPRVLAIVAAPKAASRLVDAARDSFDKCLVKAKLADDVTLAVRIDAHHRAHVDHLPDETPLLTCVKAATEALAFPDGIPSATVTVMSVELQFTAIDSEDSSAVDSDTLEALRPLAACLSSSAKAPPVHVNLTIARDGRTSIASTNACMTRKRIRFPEADDPAKLGVDLSWAYVAPE